MSEPFPGFANAKRTLKADGDLPHKTALDLLGKAIADIETLTTGIQAMRDKLHAANRPMLRVGLREELRGECDRLLTLCRRS